MKPGYGNDAGADDGQLKAKPDSESEDDIIDWERRIQGH